MSGEPEPSLKIGHPATQSTARGTKRDWSLAFQIIFGAVFGVMIATGQFRRWTGNVFADGPQSLVVLGVMFGVVMFLAVVAHELGHLLGGWSVGFRPYLLQLGPFRWFRYAQRWQFAFIRGFSFFSGMAGGTSGDAQRIRSRFWWLILCGPLASILTAIAAWLLAWRLAGMPSNSFESNSLGDPAFHLGLYATYSILMGVTNLIPRVIDTGSLNGLMTDGFRLRRLLKRGPEIESEVAVIQLYDVMLSGKRPCTWDAMLLERASQGQTVDHFLASGNIFAYYAALDSGDAVRAEQFLDRALELKSFLPLSSQADLGMEAAFFAARYGRNLERARTMLELAVAGFWQDRLARCRAEAALALAEGRFEDAAQQVLAAQQLIPGDGIQGLYVMNHHWLEDLLRDARVAGATTVQPAILPKPGNQRHGFSWVAGTFWFLVFVGVISDLRLLPLLPGFSRTLLADLISDQVWLLPVCIGFFPLLILPVLIKLGTLIAGRTVGFRFSAFHITSLWRIERIDNRWRLGSNLVSGILGETGLCGPEDDQDLLRRTRIASFGGWWALVLVGSTLLGICVWLETTLGWRKLIRSVLMATDSDFLAFAAVLLLMFAESFALGLLLAAAAWFFSLFGFNFFEAAWRWRLLRDQTANAKRETARFAMIAAASRYVRPRDWCETWVQEATFGLPQVASDVYSLGCAYFWALDRSDVNAAGAFLDKAVQASTLIPGPFRASFKLEQAYFEAAHRNNPELAQTSFEQVQRQYVDRSSLARAEAAIMLGMRKPELAKQAIDRGFKHLKHSRNAGLKFVEQDLLQALQVRADADQTAGSTLGEFEI
jgi:hypothetical protein